MAYGLLHTAEERQGSCGSQAGLLHLPLLTTIYRGLAGYIHTPSDSKLSKIVAMSGAGIDGLILTKFNRSFSRFIFRFLLSSLNLGLGDWAPFTGIKETGQHAVEK